VRIDRDVLAEAAAVEAGGLRRRRFFLDSGDGRCFALLHLPRQPRPPGFVSIHGFGQEFLTLSRVGMVVAEALAARGHPSLIYHGRGYGDSTPSGTAASLRWHLEDAQAAVNRLRLETGLDEVGLLGIKFGGYVAGAIARQGEVERLILLDPVLRPGEYVRELVQQVRMAYLVRRRPAPLTSTEEAIAVLRQGTPVDVLGYPLRPDLLLDVQEDDLTSDMGDFGGPALVLHTGRRAAESPTARAFAERIRAQGGDCRIEEVRAPAGSMTVQFVATSDPSVRADAQRPLVEDVCERALQWLAT
jgi:pimeloyl-ACP methyl ester carboxylesterase